MNKKIYSRIEKEGLVEMVSYYKNGRISFSFGIQSIDYRNRLIRSLAVNYIRSDTLPLIVSEIRHFTFTGQYT